MDARAHEAQAPSRMDRIRAAPHRRAMGDRPGHGKPRVARRAAVAPGPNGFADDEAAWIDGLSQRVDIADGFASRAAERLDAVALVEAGLGPLASADTRNTGPRAPSRAQAHVFLLRPAEFLGRKIMTPAHT